MVTHSATQNNRLNFIIREAEQADYEALNLLFSALINQHASAVPQIFRVYRRQIHSREYIERLIVSKQHALLVAEAKKRLIGVLHATLHRTSRSGPKAARRYVVVECLIVSPDARRIGVGKALMAEVHEWAAENRAKQIELTVWEFNEDALAFYESLGYSTVRRRLWFHIDDDNKLSG